MKKVLLSIWLLMLVANLGAQDFKVIQVFAEQVDDQIHIHYTIDTKLKLQRLQVSIHCSLDGGQTFSTALKRFQVYKRGNFKHYTGVGTVIAGEQEHIAKWQVLKERPEGLKSNAIVFEVRARPQASKVTNEAQLLPRMVLVKGSKEAVEYPSKFGKRKKRVVKSFYIDRFEATMRDFAAYEAKENISEYSRSALGELLSGNMAYYGVVIGDAEYYCKSKGGRLPKAHEWFYAARGGHLAQNTNFSGDNTLNKVAWTSGNTESKYPKEVGLLKPNALGLYDMNGNVAEWLGHLSVKYAGGNVKEDVFHMGGDLRASSVESNLRFMKVIKWKKTFNVKHDLIGIRLVKNTPKWKDKYTKIKKGPAKFTNKTFQITQDLELSTTEITNNAYAQFLNFESVTPYTHRVSQWINLQGKSSNNQCRIYFKKGKFRVERGYENKPVTFVSHVGARAYALWRGGRLPSEAELTLAHKQGKLKKIQVDVWCADSYDEVFWETLANNTQNPQSKATTGKHTVRLKNQIRTGYFSQNFYPNVGFRVIILKGE
ncbi:MAG TPA: hypothetical protein DCS93_44160 [Microscillaceae bacterium]|nr:hypothetical protein [Microscillaceae bacterium]